MTILEDEGILESGHASHYGLDYKWVIECYVSPVRDIYISVVILSHHKVPSAVSPRVNKKKLTNFYNVSAGQEISSVHHKK